MQVQIRDPQRNKEEVRHGASMRLGPNWRAPEQQPRLPLGDELATGNVPPPTGEEIVAAMAAGRE